MLEQIATATGTAVMAGSVLVIVKPKLGIKLLGIRREWNKPLLWPACRVWEVERDLGFRDDSPPRIGTFAYDELVAGRHPDSLWSDWMRAKPRTDGRTLESEAAAQEQRMPSRYIDEDRAAAWRTDRDAALARSYNSSLSADQQRYSELARRYAYNGSGRSYTDSSNRSFAVDQQPGEVAVESLD